MAKGKKTGGRAPGVANKATTEARIAIKSFVEGNVDRLNSWLDQIALEDPEAAFKAFMSVLEYNLPKLARTEHAGHDGKELQIGIFHAIPTAPNGDKSSV